MILQNFIFPKKEICEKETLYFRKEQGSANIEYSSLKLSAQSKVSFFTYFNEFSLTRWRDYTGINDYQMHVKVCGKGNVQLMHASLQDGKVIQKKLVEQQFSTGPDQHTKLIFQISPNVKDGIVYARICAESVVLVSSGSFETCHGIASRIRIAIGICTYHREEDVTRTVTMLREAFLENKTSPLYRNIKVYVSDNGGTLGRFDGAVTCVKNKNAGGAGGFARCMIEALQEWETYQFTHFLFMDDDILMESEAVYRTYMLLAAGIRYKNAAIGGALLRSDFKDMQHACGERWEWGHILSPRQGFCLSKKWDLMQNEQSVPVQYNGWWYCCVPFSKNEASDLPLPLFIHGDDIEYGLRKKQKLLYLNGIGVWHNSFENRKASCMEYYDIRNTLLVLSALSRKKVYWKHVERRIVRHMAGQLLKYRYRDMDLIVWAVADFCKGAAFLKNQDPEVLNHRIIKAGYQMKDMSKELDLRKPEWRERQCRKSELYRKKHFGLHHIILCNGWLLPGRRENAVFPMGVWAGHIFGYQQVLYYDPDTGMGFKCARRYQELLHFIKNWHIIRQLLRNNFKNAVYSYRMHCQDLKSIEFWNKYLELYPQETKGKVER